VKEFTMNAHHHRLAAAAILVAAILPATFAHAQLGDLLKQGESAGSSGGGLGDLGGALSGKSMMSGSAGNVAGVLQFCIKNNYLSGNAASSVKDSLMGKLSGKSSSGNDYSEGEKGILSGSDGKKLDLSGGGLKANVTKQVCDQILSQGKSLL
jgi:hypothetical protein